MTRPREPLRRNPPRLFARRRRAAARLGHASSTRSPGSAPSGCGGCCTSGRSCRALGALTGNQALQQVKAGLEAIYLSGWQVAADANNAGEMYPDQSLYPASSVPEVVRRINKTFQRADQIAKLEGDTSTYWFAPIVADAEAGFGGPLNAFELMKAMIEAGAAGVHFEDQLASEKKCGHLGGKVLVPTQTFIRTLNAARLAADVCGVDDAAHRAHRRAFGDADHQRHRRARPAVDFRRADERGLLPPEAGQRPLGRACDRARPRLCALCRPRVVGNLRAGPRRGARIRGGDPSPLPGQAARLQLLAVVQLAGQARRRRRSPSFQEQLAEMGYRFQFVTLAGFHALNLSMFELAKRLPRSAAWRPTRTCRSASSRRRRSGFTAVRHQREVGTVLLRRGRDGGLRRQVGDGRDGRLDRDLAIPTGVRIKIPIDGDDNVERILGRRRDVPRRHFCRAGWRGRGLRSLRFLWRCGRLLAKANFDHHVQRDCALFRG